MTSFAARVANGGDVTDTGWAPIELTAYVVVFGFEMLKDGMGIGRLEPDHHAEFNGVMGLGLVFFAVGIIFFGGLTFFQLLWPNEEPNSATSGVLLVFVAVSGLNSFNARVRKRRLEALKTASSAVASPAPLTTT
ncbi:MAG TPA: hypothetical protein VGB53_02685 [Rubricoccaceae bacterium]